MANPRAIAGEFADFKLVKTRSVAQIVIEIPIEEGEQAVRMFGIPQPGKPVQLALARIVEGKQTESEVVPDTDRSSSRHTGTNTKQAGERREWSSLSPATQAGIRCAEPRFQAFLRDKGFMASCATADDAATYVRFICGVDSRAKIGKDRDSLVKWKELEGEYQAWLIEPEVAA